jgi:hypothetical protein
MDDVEELVGGAPDVYRQGGTVRIASPRLRSRSAFFSGTLVTLRGAINMLSTRVGDQW